MAVSFDPQAPYEREERPDFGLYLDGCWHPPWEHAHVDWPDFGVPADARTTLADLTAFRERSHAGQRVEIGCLGGHGRTGTALAMLAVLSGCAPGTAVAWVRAHYCDHAVETPGQEAFVAAFTVG